MASQAQATRSQASPHGGPRALRPVQVMYLYAAADSEDRDSLEKHLWGLRWQRLVQTWDASRLLAGSETQEATQHLREAEVVLVLTSANLFSDPQAMQLLDRALATPELVIIAVQVRMVDLESTPLQGLPLVPAGVAIHSRPDLDAAWREVAVSLRLRLRERAAQGVGPTPLPLPLRYWAQGLRDAVAARLPLALGLLLLLGLLGLRQLGVEIHRLRLDLIGVSESSQRLSYSEGELLKTGLHALWKLGALMLTGPLQGHGGEQAVLPFVLAAVGGVAAAGRWAGGKTRAALLLLLLPVCLIGTVWLKVALRPQHVWLYSAVQPATSCRLSEEVATSQIALPRQIAAEVCSWLYNYTPDDRGRLAALASGWGWAALGLLYLCWLAARTARLPTWLRRSSSGAAAVYLWLGLWMAVEMPRADALVDFGLHYPKVRSLQAACGGELGPAIAQGRCRAWDLSAGAHEELLALRCDCPGCPEKGVRWHQGRCVEQFDNVEIIDHGRLSP